MALIPTRYANTPAQGDDAAKLARATHWQDAGGETYVGIGQRLFAIGDEDIALLDMRELILDQEAADG